MSLPISPPTEPFRFAVEPEQGLISRMLVSQGIKQRPILHGERAYVSKIPLPYGQRQCYFIYGKEERFWGLLAGGSPNIEEITYAAMRLKDGVVFAPHRPNRHGEIYSILEAYGVAPRSRADATEGFLTSWGRFVDREEGLALALKAQQVRLDHEGKKRCHPSYELFSEDIW